MEELLPLLYPSRAQISHVGSQLLSLQNYKTEKVGKAAAAGVRMKVFRSSYRREAVEGEGEGATCRSCF